MCAWKGQTPWTALWKTTAMARTQPPTQPAGPGPTPSASQTARHPFLLTLRSQPATHSCQLWSSTPADLDPSGCLNADHLWLRCLDKLMKQYARPKGVNTSSTLCCLLSAFLVWSADMEEHVAGSPYDITVVPGPASARHTVISGPGRQAALTGKEARFEVEAKDAFGNRSGLAGANCTRALHQTALCAPLAFPATLPQNSQMHACMAALQAKQRQGTLHCEVARSSVASSCWSHCTSAKPHCL